LEDLIRLRQTNSSQVFFCLFFCSAWPFSKVHSPLWDSVAFKVVLSLVKGVLILTGLHEARSWYETCYSTHINVILQKKNNSIWVYLIFLHWQILHLFLNYS